MWRSDKLTNRKFGREQQRRSENVGQMAWLEKKHTSLIPREREIRMMRMIAFFGRSFSKLEQSRVRPEDVNGRWKRDCSSTISE
jgi:hypothetical protein